MGDRLIDIKYDAAYMRDIEVWERPDGTRFEKPLPPDQSFYNSFKVNTSGNGASKPVQFYNPPKPPAPVPSSLALGCTCAMCVPPVKDNGRCPKCEEENTKGGIARGLIAQIAEAVGVDLGENVGGDRWSEENMKRVVRGVKKMTKEKRKTDVHLAKAEVALEEVNQEADDLFHKLNLITIERDYLLEQVEWHSNELMEAWGQMEVAA